MARGFLVGLVLIVVVGCTARSSQTPETLDEWIAAARAGSDRDRINAIQHIGAMKEKAGPAGPVLADCLKDANVSVRLAAANALAFIGPEAKEAVPVLAKVLNEDVGWQVRRAAAVALNYMKGEGKSAVPALVKALKDSNEGVRYEAAAALRNIDPLEAKLILGKE